MTNVTTLLPESKSLIYPIILENPLAKFPRRDFSENPGVKYDPNKYYIKDLPNKKFEELFDECLSEEFISVIDWYYDREELPKKILNTKSTLEYILNTLFMEFSGKEEEIKLIVRFNTMLTNIMKRTSPDRELSEISLQCKFSESESVQTLLIREKLEHEFKVKERDLLYKRKEELTQTVDHVKFWSNQLDSYRDQLNALIEKYDSKEAKKLLKQINTTGKHVKGELKEVKKKVQVNNTKIITKKGRVK